MKTFQLKTAMALKLGHMTYIDQSWSFKITGHVTLQGKHNWPIGSSAILHNTFSLLWSHQMTSHLYRYLYKQGQLGGTVIDTLSTALSGSLCCFIDIESCYANIDREHLSVCFGLEKFHTYIYGRHVLVENDHKPLEMIQHKTIHVAPPRLHQMLLCMQKYDHTIVYKPRKDMVLADSLSLFPSNTNYLPIALAQNIQHVQLSTSELGVIQGSVEHNPVYSTVYCLTLRRWPDQVQDIPHIPRHFWGARDELSIDNGLLLKRTRVCIPPALLKRTLADLHGAHQGVDRIQAQAREAVYWPGIDSDIWLCQSVHYLHQTQSFSACPANAS